MTHKYPAWNSKSFLINLVGAFLDKLNKILFPFPAGNLKPSMRKVAYNRANRLTFNPKPKKTKKIKKIPEKNSLYFRKRNFLSQILKKIIIFSYIFGNETF